MIVDGEEIECITFDLDDTLWLCEPVILNAEFVFYSWLEEYYPRITAAITAEDMIYHRRKVFAGFPEMSHDFSWMRQRWLEGLAQEFSYDQDALRDEGFEIFLSARNDVHLFDGAHELLHLVSQRYTCGTITNGNADVGRIGIDHFFKFNITAADAGASKPDPTIFLSASEAAGIAPERILHIGDDPERDVRGAANVGMKTLWINPQGRPWKGIDKPDLELRIINELGNLLSVT